ncbi:ribosome-associated translation inhibitor RaiA [bacterium]|nr:ribosome-associated translation inhibitor RaiA [bacterium]
MRISVTFRHMEANDALKEYVTQKMGKLKKYLNEPIDVNVVLSQEKFRNNVEVTLSAERNVINGHDQEEDMYAAVDLVLDKIERQVKRAKDKVQDHRPNGKDVPEVTP